MNFGGAGLPHAIRQPETARRQKKSGILGLFPYRASGPFPALFYCPSDRVPTDIPAAQPILARFLPAYRRIRDSVGPTADPASRRPDFYRADSGMPDRIGFLTRPRFRCVDLGMPDPRLSDRESDADARSDRIPRSTDAVRSDPPDPPVRRDRRISL